MGSVYASYWLLGITLWLSDSVMDFAQGFKASLLFDRIRSFNWAIIEG